MSGFHSAASMPTLAAAGVLVLAAVLAALLDRWHEPVRWLSWLVVAAFGVQAAIGLAAMVSGAEPGESLHLLYALGLLAVVPVGLSFASQAPARARSGVLAVTGVVALLLAWRLLITG